VDPTAGHSYFVIARIVRPRGNRGEVLADLHTDFPERFSILKTVWLEFQDGSRETHELQDSWVHQGRMVLKFAEIDSISQAETLKGAWVEIESAEAVALPEGSYWDHDLVGCTVRNLQGDELGTVAEFLRIAGNEQLMVRGQQGEFMIPFVASICRDISIDRKEILVDLPEGLMDLNR
jgi:16S rRNA processing protein RimM